MGRKQQQQPETRHDSAARENSPFSKADRITFMIVGGMIGLGIVAVLFLQ
jgi:hypothetical protein